MKYTFSILLLTLVVNVKGQQIKQIDTVNCLMLICDTASVKVWSSNGIAPNMDHLLLDRSVSWDHGYIVYEAIVEIIDNWGDPGIRLGRRFFKYLDSKKKPLKKSVIIWDSIELK